MSHSNMADGNPSRRPVGSSATPRGVIVMNVIGSVQYSRLA